MMLGGRRAAWWRLGQLFGGKPNSLSSKIIFFLSLSLFVEVDDLRKIGCMVAPRLSLRRPLKYLSCITILLVFRIF